MPRKPGPKNDLPHGEVADRITVTLDALTVRRLRVLGDGNVSQGVRVAARAAYDRYQRSDSFTRGKTTAELDALAAWSVAAPPESPGGRPR